MPHQHQHDHSQHAPRQQATVLVHATRFSSASPLSFSSVDSIQQRGLHRISFRNLRVADFTPLLQIMAYYHTLILRFDGACRGRNRDSGSGWVLLDGTTTKVVAKGRYYIGTGATNNVAEYMGLFGGLKFIRDEGIQIRNMLHVQGDSELVIKHLKGDYHVRSPRLRPLYRRCRKMLDDFDFEIDLEHIYRDRNTDADELANEAIDSEERSAEWS